MTKTVILQGFNWTSFNHGSWNKHLQQNIKGFKAKGIDKIWLPPLSKSHSSEGYFPDDHYNFNSAYGSSEDLWRLIDECNENEVDAIADVISWTCLPSFCREKFNFDGKIVSNDDKWEHLCNWTHYLSEKGVNGFRLDMAGIVPFDFVSHMPDNSFIVGEIWGDMNYNNSELIYNQDAHRQQIVDYIDNTRGLCHAFDFTTKGILQEALNSGEYWRLIDCSGQPYGVVGWYPQKSVTFIDNHDTQGQHMWPFGNKLVQGYAYILFHKGVSCIYYDHLCDEVYELIQICKDIGDAYPIIHEANNERYVCQRGCYFIEIGHFKNCELGEILFEHENIRLWKE